MNRPTTYSSVNVVPIAVQRRLLAWQNFLLSWRYFAVQLQRYRDVHFQAASINRPPLYIWLKLPRRTPVGMCSEWQLRWSAAVAIHVLCCSSCVAMAARYPCCAVLMWLHGVVRRRYVAGRVRREEECGCVGSWVGFCMWHKLPFIKCMWKLHVL